MKRYIQAGTGGAIFKVVKSEGLYGHSEYTVYYKPYTTRRFSEAKLPSQARAFMEQADNVEESGGTVSYTMKVPERNPALDTIERVKVSLTDVDPKDILINIANGYASVVNYTFAYDGAYANSYALDIYNKPMFPLGTYKGVQYGVIGQRKKRDSYHGGYIGYKIEDGYLWCNNFTEDIKADAIKYAKESISNPSGWDIYGKIL